MDIDWEDQRMDRQRGDDNTRGNSNDNVNFETIVCLLVGPAISLQSVSHERSIVSHIRNSEGFGNLASNRRDK
jgi:hypothetical protein